MWWSDAETTEHFRRHAALHMALVPYMEGLAKVDADQSRLVELRYFGGLTIDETAEVMQTSPATVSREWNSARAWLFRELLRGAAPSA